MNCESMMALSHWHEDWDHMVVMNVVHTNFHWMMGRGDDTMLCIA